MTKKGQLFSCPSPIGELMLTFEYPFQQIVDPYDTHPYKPYH